MLSMICGVRTQFGPLYLFRIPDPTGNAQQLLDALDISLPESIIDQGILVATRKHINETR